ncbi:reverse transcriptase [Cucumis melo var. makuwa]|uniref:Reverse transcriptase n=1 Tax=Cucumis melo var. makuwa TaxID=1194695 RepID=A0A5A7TD80_CUCMM|nr:reverse transcriptase [Cucumis melo var. makuwa]TYK16059.1 reverse transcriptase [Cucumis melo var. makuwa]
MSESDKSETTIPENISEQGNIDTKIILDGNGSNDENVDTRSYTKHSIANYISYENLSPQFRDFTTSLDSNVIPKNIHIALDCPKWKNFVMEEMGALEKNKTWEICTLPKGHKTVGGNGCSLSSTRQMELLTDTRQDLVEEVYLSSRLDLKPSLVNRYVNSRNSYMA